MKFVSKAALVLVCVLPLTAPLRAQQQRDPLNDLESDQLREAAQDPYKRLKLMIHFTPKPKVADSESTMRWRTSASWSTNSTTTSTTSCRSNRISASRSAR